MDKLITTAIKLTEHVLGLCNDTEKLNVFEIILLLIAVYLLEKALSILGLRKSVNKTHQG